MKAPMLVGLVTVLAALPAFSEKVEFKDAKDVALKAHVDGKPAAPAEGTKLTVDEKGATLVCDFTTAGHDAAWIEFPCELAACKEIFLERTISDNKQQLYVVLTDKNGESHLFKFNAPGNARQKVRAEVLEKNKHPGEYFAWRWGGDDNQKIDWPVKKIAFGVNDQPDTFVGKVTVTFHSFETK